MTTISKMRKDELRALVEDLLATDKIKSAEIEMLKELNDGQTQANWDMWDSNTRLMSQNSRLKHRLEQSVYESMALLVIGGVIGVAIEYFIN